MLNDLFGNNENIKILDSLLEVPIDEFTEEEISKNTSLDKDIVKSIIKKYIELGIINADNKTLQFNYESLLFKKLMEIDAEISNIFVRKMVGNGSTS